MFVEHIGIWTKDLEKMKEFYCKYFNGISNEKYTNKLKEFESYFISFKSGARIELMRKKYIDKRYEEEFLGLSHIGFKMKNKEEVNELTDILKKDGYKIIGEPRITGDGYYESVILDPEGNKIELIG